MLLKKTTIKDREETIDVVKGLVIDEIMRVVETNEIKLEDLADNMGVSEKYLEAVLGGLGKDQAAYGALSVGQLGIMFDVLGYDLTIWAEKRKDNVK